MNQSRHQSDAISRRQTRNFATRIALWLQASVAIALLFSATFAFDALAVNPAFPYTTGEQKTAVILVNFQDNNSQPISASDANSLVFTTVNNFYKENSYQQAWFTGAVYGWYTIAASQTSCDTGNIATLADQAAAAAGVDLSVYRSRVYFFPRSSSCGWDGLSAGSGPGRVWINGKFELGNVGHELGHNMSLAHAHSWDCDTSALASNCVYGDYGDLADIMGNASGAGHLNAFQKESLGWLNTSGVPPISTISSSGSYSIDAMEPAGTAPKALKILKSTDPTTGKRTWYYVEYRQPQGADLAFSYFPGLYGIQIRVGTEGSVDSSFLLDMTPQSLATGYDLRDSALPLGQTYTDSAAGVTIKSTWANGVSAGIDVTLSSPPPPSTTSTFADSVTTDATSYLKGATVNITSTVLAQGVPAAGVTVALTVTKPGGTKTTTSVVTNGKGVATYSLKLARNQSAVGTYSVAAAAMSGSQTATATTSFTAH